MKTKIKLPQTIFLFGLSGAGKNYVGNLLERWGGFHFYDADKDMPADMAQAIARGEPFQESQRDRFFEIVCKRIAELLQVHPRLVIAQAAYKQRHRDLLAKTFPTMAIIWVDAPWNCIDERLIRLAGNITPTYARLIAKNFEVPPPATLRIENSRDDSYIIAQLESLFVANEDDAA